MLCRRRAGDEAHFAFDALELLQIVVVVRSMGRGESEKGDGGL
jgi:hypothetical protein